MDRLRAKIVIPLLLLIGARETVLSAYAGGFLNTLQSATGASSAGAGVTALGEDAATIWYNPAGMVLLQRPEALAAGGLIFPSTSFQNNGSTDAAGFPTGGNTSTNPTDFLLPSVFASFPVTEQLHLGLGVFAPFGQDSKYDDDWVGRYQVQQVALKTVDIRPALAYRINSLISIGGALDVQYAHFRSANAIDFGTLCFSIGACAATPEGADGRLLTSLSSWGVGYDFGVLVEPSTDVRIGANYKSGIHGGFTGDTHFNVPPVAMPLMAGGAFGNTSGNATLSFPQVVSLGGVWRINEYWTALLDTSWTQWSEVQQLALNFSNQTPAVVQPLHWHDSWKVAFGGIYRVSDSTDLRAGLAFDQSPIGGQYRTADLPQSDAIVLGLGLRQRVNDHLELGLSYDYTHYVNASLDLAQPGTGTLIGTGHQQAHTVGVQARWRF